MKSRIKILMLAAIILPSTLAAAETALPNVASYSQLVAAIRETKAQTKERIEARVEQEKVREAWEIGKLIDAHVLQHKERANYDEQVLERLAKDLGSSATDIRYTLRFARAYPIQPPAAELSWSHYRELLSIEDSKEREFLAERAEKENWGRDRLREEVRKRRAPGKETEPVILTAQAGKPGTYGVVKAGFGKYKNQPVLDLGFSNY